MISAFQLSLQVCYGGKRSVHQRDEVMTNRVLACSAKEPILIEDAC